MHWQGLRPTRKDSQFQQPAASSLSVHPQPEIPPPYHGVGLSRLVLTAEIFGWHALQLAAEARLAQYRVWLKPSGEQHFVYGNHVVKASAEHSSCCHCCHGLKDSTHQAKRHHRWLERCAFVHLLRPPWRRPALPCRLE